jgi:hypothetical protein
VAVRPKAFDATVGQRWYAVFDPTPDAAYDLEYSYKVEPGALTATNHHPLGGPEIGELILQSCLAVAEQRYRDGPGIHTQVFLAKLQAAIANDAQSFSPDSLGGRSHSDDCDDFHRQRIAYARYEGVLYDNR